MDVASAYGSQSSSSPVSLAILPGTSVPDNFLGMAQAQTNKTDMYLEVLYDLTWNGGTEM